ncbi:CobW family GTP-binding protein [Mycetocola reblochoni]|uniref:Cobalamin biosynthesis protein CobW n=2 Tax=Mycetocola reblochoni TaxID=331618 RepID=A0A3L6ZP38_9MICO|nr:GTP-binding protein [Mycetocola reblochoni]RLP69679.1 cobalamin biosynthesis protein CobW [Mycetocola reblochoni]SJN38437.1 Putative metal chaperone, involved in Zn homeostasis, GTPase of COG0523 family [Mycetocola reblochoni REB411]
MTIPARPEAAPSPHDGSARRVPVVAITGRLGAGKTTLLNHLLRTPGARLGVVVNDFGAINVDAGLVTGQVDEAAAISGGCLCCLPESGGLDDALERLSAPRLRLDAILIEASGVADPVALARLIRFSGVESIRPAGVVEVVDALEESRPGHDGDRGTADDADDTEVTTRRHAATTLAVIGKSELLVPAERDAVTARIAEHVTRGNPAAVTVVAERGRIDPALVFDAATAEDPADELPIARLLRDAEHHHAHARSASIVLHDAVSARTLLDLLESPPPGAYRLKGRVRVPAARGERGYLVNVVGRQVHVAALPSPPERGELVAIGPGLDVAEAGRRLDELAEQPSPRPDATALRGLARHRRLSR